MSVDGQSSQDLPTNHEPDGSPTSMPDESPEVSLDYDRGEAIEKLWKDTSIVSFSLRRHGDYERDPESGMRGALHREGIDAARESSSQWVEQLPGDADISIYQSPSYQTAKVLKDKSTGIPREVRPARATITASLYEKELFGKLEPGRRETEPRLGDFFETATSSEGVANFFKVMGDHYGKLTPQFWKDFAERTLPPEVNRAMVEAGGQDSLQLARNVVGWLEESSSKKNDQAERKRIGLAITHGETIYSFLHNLSHYLELTGTTDGETLKVFRDYDPTYNQGMDIHVSDDEITVVVANKHAAAFPLGEYKKYLQELDAGHEN